MSADFRGAGSAAESRRWYLEVSGHRAGPFAWGVLVELAQAGALGPDDRVWRMGLAGWSRAGELADLVPLIREPALCLACARGVCRRGRRSARTTGPAGSEHRMDRTHGLLLCRALRIVA